MCLVVFDLLSHLSISLFHSFSSIRMLTIGPFHPSLSILLETSSFDPYQQLDPCNAILFRYMVEIYELSQHGSCFVHLCFKAHELLFIQGLLTVAFVFLRRQLLSSPKENVIVRPPVTVYNIFEISISGKPFIWVVRRVKKGEGEEDEWLPCGFEARMKGKGLIIRGWAPQVLILEHEAIGGFVTHCGWNSTLEGVSAGKPMVTWPVAAEQFYNEKLVTDVLKIGVGIGVKRWVKFLGDEIKSEAVEKGIRRIMEGEEGEEMRRRARKLGKKAREAVEKDGSSYSDFNALLDQLKQRK